MFRRVSHCADTGERKKKKRKKIKKLSPLRIKSMGVFFGITGPVWSSSKNRNKRKDMCF